MAASVVDIPAIMSKWSCREKKLAVATLLREMAETKTALAVTIEDETSRPIGLFYSTEYEVEDLDLNEKTPGMQELKQLAQDRSNAVSHDELKAILREVDLKQGRQ